MKHNLGTQKIQLLCDRSSAGADPGALLPVRLGIPFAPGQIAEPGQIGVIDSHDARSIAQKKVLSRWPDSSIRWCLVEFLCLGDPASYTLEIAAERNVATGSPTQVPANPLIAIEPETQRGSTDTAVLRHRLFNEIVALQIRLRHDSQSYLGVLESARTIDTGPIRWSQTWSVRFDASGKSSPLTGNLIANVYADLSTVTFEFAITNPLAMDHPGGNWDLGAAGSVIINDLSFHFSLPKAAQQKRLSAELRDSGQTLEASQQLRIFQASSGGENWNSHNHLDRHGRVPLEFRGYRANADGQELAGLRAEPLVAWKTSSAVYGIGYRDFWQNFPKVLAAEGDGLRIGLFPLETVGGHELQGGEQKTHEFAFEWRQTTEQSTIDVCINPPLVSLTPDAYAEAQAWPYLEPRSRQSDPVYESLVDLALDGQDTFAIKNEKIDEFGWRHFGDVYGDHEAVYHRGKTALISHYNNQYDCVLGFALQFLRRGDPRWYELMIHMADHAWDIDTYHTQRDKLVYNGGLFWHTYHYADAHTSTHRSYPRQLRVSQSFEGGQDLSALGETGEKLAKNYAIGGGPAAAHNYSTGWMLAYWLTGTERYRTAAINAADYVMRIEDGSQTPFRFLSRHDTWHSTASSAGYFGPGRAAANSTHALLTGHELMGDDKYLQRAALLMRRTVHPTEDLQELNLLNAELRWFYTMYLQALGRFVDYKYTLGQYDEDFNYGVASLLHYAQWMVEHERPTLSVPEELHYPTETWAAQDMRKWHILQHAALYASDPQQRRRLREKAEFFFHYGCETLWSFRTRSLCRPVVLLLNFGWQRDWYNRHSEHLRTNELSEQTFGPRIECRPQRTVATRRFKRLCIALAIVIFLGLATFSVTLLAYLGSAA